MKNIIKIGVILFLFIINNNFAQMCLVANKSFGEIKLTKEEAINIVLMRRTAIKNQKIRLLDIKGQNEKQIEFFKKLGYELTEIRKTWMKNVLTGKANSPLQVSTFEEMKAKIIEIQNAVGYLPKNLCDQNVIILYETE